MVIQVIINDGCDYCRYKSLRSCSLMSFNQLVGII